MATGKQRFYAPDVLQGVAIASPCSDAHKKFNPLPDCRRADFFCVP